MTRVSSLFEVQTAGYRMLPIEGLRGFSAMLVFFVHFHTIFGSLAAGSPLFSPSLYLSNLGHCGVDVFFALSGFVIYGPLISRPIQYGRFVRKRIVRLYPVFTAVFAAYLIASALAPSFSKLSGPLPERAFFVLTSFLMLPGILPWPPFITVAWSLSYELFFYLSIPLLIRLLGMSRWSRRARIAFWLSACAGIWVVSLFASLRHPRLIMFGCGILLWELNAAFPTAPRTLDWFAAGAFLFALALAGIRPSSSFLAPTSALLPWTAIVLLCFFTGTLLLVRAATASPGFLSRLFSLNGLRYFGNFSYSYYLIHGAVLLGSREVYTALGLPSRLSPLPYLALMLGGFTLTTVVASLLFLCVEKPFSLAASARPRLPSTPSK